MYKVAVDVLVKRYKAYQSRAFYLLPREPNAVYLTKNNKGEPLYGVKGELERDEEHAPPKLVRSIVLFLLQPFGVKSQPPETTQWYVYLNHEADGSWTESFVQVGEGTVHCGSWGEAMEPPPIPLPTAKKTTEKR